MVAKLTSMVDKMNIKHKPLLDVYRDLSDGSRKYLEEIANYLLIGETNTRKSLHLDINLMPVIKKESSDEQR